MSEIVSTTEKLNRTLEKVCSVLHKNNIKDWFIFYGTLLGIIREDSCIEGDDDLDIMINCDYQLLRSVFEKEGFKFTSNFCIKNPDTILKSEPTEEYESFDFYICTVNEAGDFFTQWEATWLRNAYEDKTKKTFPIKKWKTTTLHLPYKAEQRLALMYGDWRTPVQKRKVGRCKDIGL